MRNQFMLGIANFFGSLSLQRKIFMGLGLAVVLLYPLLDVVVVRPILGPQIGAIVPMLIYIILALGLNIVVGYAGLLDLGYAAFFAIGAYTTAILTSPRSPLFTGQWTSNFWISMFFAFFAAMSAGVILGAPTLRLRGDYLAIVTLGFGEIVPVAFRNASDLTYGEKGLAPIARPEIFGYPFSDALQAVLRGPSDWSPGERELFAGFASLLNSCHF